MERSYQNPARPGRPLIEQFTGCPQKKHQTGERARHSYEAENMETGNIKAGDTKTGKNHCRSGYSGNTNEPLDALLHCNNSCYSWKKGAAVCSMDPLRLSSRAVLFDKKIYEPFSAHGGKSSSMPYTPVFITGFRTCGQNPPNSLRNRSDRLFFFPADPDGRTAGRYHFAPGSGRHHRIFPLSPAL